MSLSPRSINMTVTLLGSILDAAMDDDELGPLIARNGARGRRIKERAPSRTYLDTAAQVAALLDAAGELDRSAPKDRRHVKRRAMLATLVFAGLRIGELCGLRWRDVDLAGGWLTVGASKTDAGRRRVKIRGALRDELLAVRSRGPIDPDGYVFPTRTGAQLGADNFRNRVLAAASKRANERLTDAGHAPLPKLTPHSLRRTFCSLLYALGESPPVVMAEMGHTDPASRSRSTRRRCGATRSSRSSSVRSSRVLIGRTVRPSASRRRSPSRREQTRGITCQGHARDPRNPPQRRRLGRRLGERARFEATQPVRAEAKIAYLQALRP